VYDGKTGRLFRTFYGLTPASFTGGVFVAAGDVNGDGFVDVIVGADAGGGPQIDVWDGRTGALLRIFNALAPTFAGVCAWLPATSTAMARPTSLRPPGRAAAPR